MLFSTWWFVETVGTIRDFLQGRWGGFGFGLMIHNSYTARIAIPLLYRAPLSEEITWGKLHELGNCINEFFRQNALFFSSWGLNTITNSFTNIRQLDPRWPVIVSAQKYLFVAEKFSWHWEQLILPMNLKNVLVGEDNVIFFFFPFGKTSYNLEKKNEGC